MSDFGKTASQIARQLPYTEYDAEDMASSRAQTAGDVIDEVCEEPRLDELCAVLDLSTENLDTPAREFSARDVALAAWSNWGAGDIHSAAAESSLSEGEFIVLNDYFRDIVQLSEE